MSAEPAKSNYFKFLNSTCNVNELSSYHDLKCGHRIQVEHPSSCGTNCERTINNYPFVCATCVADEVRTQLILNGITLDNEDDEMDDGSREQAAEELVKDNLFRLIYSKAKEDRHRPCKVTKKFETPKEQYFNDWLETEGMEGIEVEEKKKPAPQFRPAQDLFQMQPAAQAIQQGDSSWQAPEPEQPAAPVAADTVYQKGDDPEDDDPDKLWCHCRQKDTGSLMAECCNPACEIQWYHVRCLGPFEAPTGNWWCAACTRADPTDAIMEALELGEGDDSATTMEDTQAIENIGGPSGSAVTVGEEAEDMVMKAVVEQLDAMILAQNEYD
jgi:hypothetical protein